MFNPTEILIQAFAERLQHAYENMYGQWEPSFPSILSWAGRMALECIANSDALYHDVEHTIMVTLVGQEILKGKHIREGGVLPNDWLHFVISLMCHDIGYVRGVCRADREDAYTTGIGDDMITLLPGATDAALTPYHIDRGKRFIQERFEGHQLIDTDIIAENIERTRFPVPDDSDHQGTADFPGLVRAADLIGQLADPNHLQKLPALFYEFEETGTSVKLGYQNPDDLREDYPSFYWNVVCRYIRDGVHYLRLTQEGKQWIANLYAHVFAVEHHQH